MHDPAVETWSAALAPEEPSGPLAPEEYAALAIALDVAWAEGDSRAAHIGRALENTQRGRR